MNSNRRTSVLLIVGVLALLVVGYLATRRRQSQGGTAVLPSVSASVSAVASVAVVEPPPTYRTFVFECESFGESHAPACAAAPGPEQALLDLANSYAVSALSCAAWSGKVLAEAEHALHALESLDPAQLAPIDKALIQNALLELGSCAAATQAGEKPLPLAAKAKALLPTYALTPQEIAALPQSSELLGPWLGDPKAWTDGRDGSFFHTRSDAFARTHRQIRRDTTLGDIVRLVLVNKNGAAQATDVVQRIVLRRMDSDGVHNCIAELASSTAGCGPTALHALEPSRGQAVLAGNGATPPCNGCHQGTAAKAQPYGPATGFALDPTSESRIKAGLKALLAH